MQNINAASVLVGRARYVHAAPAATKRLPGLPVTRDCPPLFAFADLTLAACNLKIKAT